MDDETFATIEKLRQANGPAAALEELIRTLEARRDFHRLFEALLIKKRFDMGLNLARPTSFDTVPEPRQSEFEDSYVAAARRVGEAFLADGNIPQAWIYLRTIREPQAVAAALNRIDSNGNLPDNVDELISVALYERAH